MSYLRAPLSNVSGGQAQKIFVSIFLSTVAVTTLTLRTQPFDGYAISLFGQIDPVTIAGLAVLATLINAYLYFRFRNGGELRRFDGAVLTVMILPFAFVFVYLPLLLGYSFTQRDAAGHFTSILHIVRLDRLPHGGEYVYPLMHTQVASVSTVTGITPKAAYALSGLLYGGVILGLVFLVSRALTGGGKGQTIALWAAFATFPFTVFPQTRVLGYLLGLFFILCYVHEERGESRGRWRWLQILLAPALVTGHILAALITFGYLLTVIVIGELLGHRSKQRISVVILFVLCTYWIQHIGIWRRALPSTIRTGGKVSVNLGTVSRIGTFLDFTLLDYVSLALVRAGDVLIVFAISVGAVLILILSRRTGGARRNEMLSDHFVFASLPLVVMTPIQFAVPVFSFMGLRLMNIAKYLSPAYVTVVEDRSAGNASVISGATVRRVVVVTIVLLSVVSLIQFHPAGIGLKSNGYVLDSDEDGVQWFFSHKERDVEYRKMSVAPVRRMAYLLPPEERLRRSEELEASAFSKQKRLPEEADYESVPLRQIIEAKSHVIVNERDRQTYVRQLEGYYYTASTFDALDTSPESARVYDNGNVEQYVVASNGSTSAAD